MKTPKTVPVGIAYGADVFQSSLICLTTPNLCFVFVFVGTETGLSVVLLLLASRFETTYQTVKYMKMQKFRPKATSEAMSQEL